MSITMNYAAGRKGKRASSSPSHSIHSPPSASSSPLPKIKLNVRPSHSRPGSSSSRPFAGPSTQRRSIFSDDSSSDLTPAEDEDDNDDNDDEDLTEDEFPIISPSRKGKKRDPVSHMTPLSTKDKGKAKDNTPQGTTNPHSTHQLHSSSGSRPTASGPNGRDRKRIIKLGEVARRRARDDKFGFGGDRFGGATPTQSRIGSSYVESDSTSSYGDDESEQENMQSGVDEDETDDEFMGTLPEALAGQEIEDLAYGGGPIDFALEEEPEQWWQEEEDDEDFIANLTGSDIEALQSQSSVHGSESDDPMTSSTEENESDDTMDEFGFPRPFGGELEQPSDAPLILMENWDGQFVLVQPRKDKASRSRRSKNGSTTAGSVGESTSLSAGEQHLVIDEDANDEDTDSDWSGFEGEDDGGDTTDSMAEEDMPVLDSPALDEIIGQQLASNYSSLSTSTVLDMDMFNPSIVVTDMCAEATPMLTTGAVSAVGSPVTTTSPPMMGLSSAPTTPMANLPAPVPVMGTFNVSDAPCAHAVIDGSKTTTKSPFTRRKRNNKLADVAEAASVASKRRSHTPTADPHSPMGKKVRYSSIPGHPRFIAARRAAQALVDPLDRENTPSEEDDNAFSLEDMLDASMLHVNDLEPSSSTASNVQPELRHLFRFDKVPVSMYMRRNFISNNASKMHQIEATPNANAWHNYAAPPPHTPGLATGRTSLTDTLADTLAGPPSRMLISPLLQPVSSSDVEENPNSRKNRRKAKKRAAGLDMLPLQI